jgi:hypothetical protein
LIDGLGNRVFDRRPRSGRDWRAEMRVWQIATGEPGRDYRRLFFDHDIMILGPSDEGNARSGAYKYGPPNSPTRQVHQFATAPSPNDRVLARLGHEVIGVGRIPSEPEYQYDFSETFRSVYGWNLCHVQRVKWARDLDLGDLADVYRNAKEKPAFTGVNEDRIIEQVNCIPDDQFDGDLQAFPDIDTERYSNEELSEHLFREGVGNKNIEDILAALRQAERLCSWYDSQNSDRPTEHEVVSHVILPIFLGLGWSHQQIAVEWKKIDMAFFKKTPTEADNCIMVLEAKGLGKPLADRHSQARGYVDKQGLESVKYIATTDGASLFLYEKSDDGWLDDPTPIGYLDVRSLQKQYVLPKDTDLVETLVQLQPGAMLVRR